MHGIMEYDRPFYIGRSAWHGIGDVLTEAPTWDDPSVWDRFPEVEKRVMQTYDGVMVPQHRCIYRPDMQTIIGVVGKDYGLVQYREQLAVLEPLVRNFGFAIEGGGTLFNGGRAFFNLRAPGRIDPGDGSTMATYVVALTSVDGSWAFYSGSSHFRVECRNMAMAWLKNRAEEATFKIKHSLRFADHLEYARQVVETIGDVNQEAVQAWQELVRRRIDNDAAVRYFEQVFPLETSSTNPGRVKAAQTKHDRTIDKLFSLYHNANGAVPGTLWGAVMAATYYGTHEAPGDETNRVVALFDKRGVTNQTVRRAFDVAYQMAA